MGAVPMGIETVGSATYSPTAWTGVPISDYRTPSHTTGISGSSAAAVVAIGMDNTPSSSGDSYSDDEGGGPSANPTNTRKRKRGGTGGGSRSRRRMMYLFQGLMNQVVEKQEAMQQVMEKQEAMQQIFLETIENTERDRMIREDAWRRQEMARLIRENEMMALDREISASRYATVIAFLQKIITGQAIQPSPIFIPAASQATLVMAPPLQPQSIPPPAALDPPPPQPKQHHLQQIIQDQPQQQPHSSEVIITHHRQPTSTDHVTIAVPEQQHSATREMGCSGFNPASSRWQETEVLALVKLRSGLDSRYREGLKGEALWGEISAEMSRMGYSRSSKNCQKKWQRINQYFKRVKEGNKKQPEDAEPCPYFHQLDALHRKKVHGVSDQTNQESPTDHDQSCNTSSSSVDPNQTSTTLGEIMAPPPYPPQTNTTAETSIRNNNTGGGGSYIEGAALVAKKRQSNHQQQAQPMTMGAQPFTMGYYRKMMGEENDNIEDDAGMMKTLQEK